LAEAFAARDARTSDRGASPALGIKGRCVAFRIKQQAAVTMPIRKIRNLMLYPGADSAGGISRLKPEIEIISELRT
jgi:hypothetical protein